VWVRHTRTELRWLGETLGRVRDADVLSARLQRAASDGADAGGYLELQATVATARAAALEEVRAAMSSDRYVDLLERLHSAADSPPLHASGSAVLPPGASALGDLPAAEVAPPLVGRAWKRLRAQVRKAGEHPSDRQLHRIRIQAKQLRYGAELTAPVLGRRARRLAAQAERLQEVLGSHHDAVGAGQWLSAQASTASPTAAFVAGQLFVAEQHHEQRDRHRWPKVWAPLASRPGWAH
jgi:CHAD domain-containing protein